MYKTKDCFRMDSLLEKDILSFARTPMQCLLLEHFDKRRQLNTSFTGIKYNLWIVFLLNILVSLKTGKRNQHYFSSEAAVKTSGSSANPGQGILQDL